MIVLSICIILICLFGSACFSGFENGIISIRKARLQHAVQQGSRRAQRIQFFLDRPSMMFGTILLGNNLCNCLTAIYFDTLISTHFGSSVWLAFLISIFLTIIIFIWGEMLPKIWFRQQPFFRCQYLISPMYAFYVVTLPFVKTLSGITYLLTGFFTSSKGKERTPKVEREQFRLLLQESEAAYLIDREARQLLERALDFHRKRVSDIMITKDKVLSIDEGMTVAEALHYAKKCYKSRFPVCSPHSKEWVGIFSVYDALFTIDKSCWNKVLVKDYLRQLTTIGDQFGINVVLARSRLSKSPLIAVIDDAKNQVGIVSIHDVIPLLFGNLAL